MATSTAKKKSVGLSKSQQSVLENIQNLKETDNVDKTIEMIVAFNDIVKKDRDSIVDIIGKEFVSKINLLANYLQIAKRSFEKGNESAYEAFKKKFYDGYELLKTDLQMKGKSLKDVMESTLANKEYFKNNCFIKGNELVKIFVGDTGIMILMVPESNQFRCINLTADANGYHLFADGKFCSGNTFTQLKWLLGWGHIVEFMAMLSEVLGNYDDGAHHLAKKGFNKDWLDFKKTVVEGKDVTSEKAQNLTIKILNHIEKKSEKAMQVANSVKMSKEALEYMEKKFEQFKTQLAISSK